MKFMKPLIFLFAIVVSMAANAQRIKLIEGDFSALKNEKTINTEFTYDNMKVGKFDKEEDYIADRKEAYNKKEAGKGDTWAKHWVSDRDEKFEPKFDQQLQESSNMKVSKDAKYTLIFKTLTTEPGFNIGISRKNAEINGEVWLVETATKDKVLAKASVQKALGRTAVGFDFDTGLRLSEAYADAGKAIGKFIKK